MVVTGIATVVATVSRPLIEIYPSDILAGGKVTFKIYLYLVDEHGNPSPLNPDLYKVEVNAIFVTAPDGRWWLWMGPPKPLVVETWPPGADMSKFIAVEYGPGTSGWSPAPKTDVAGKWKVDFDGRFYLATDPGTPREYRWSQYFDVVKEFNVHVPEMLEISAALVINGVALFLFRNRIAKDYN